MRSIQSRLATGVLISLIMLLVGQWIIVAYSIRTLAERYVVSQLRVASDTLVAAITLPAAEPPQLNQNRVAPVYNKPFSGHYFRISAAGKLFYSRSLWDETLPVPDVETGFSVTQRFIGPQSQQLVILSSRFEKQGTAIQISVAQNMSLIINDINRFLILHGLLSLLILLILIAIQINIVRRSLRPVDQVRRELQALETGIIDNLSENVPTELQPLVQEINTRVKAVKARLQRSRNATGNLAHALKAPLTLIHQLSQHDALANQAQVRDKLVKYADTIKTIIDRELKRARLAGGAVGGRRAKIKPELQHLVSALSAMYRDKNLSIELQVPEKCVSTLEREDLHEILGNLMDNACKWASKQIKLTLICQHNLIFTVEDDGPGIPDTLREVMLQRGQRLDEQTAGHGLGLSIVKEAVEQYDGHFTLSQSETLGGLKAVIEFPNAHSRAHET